MLIDGIFCSECVDSSGESIKISGADFSDVDNNTMLLNFEHAGDSSPGHSANDLVGKVVYIKKIYKEEDCENDRQKRYFEQCGKVPCVYGVGRLFDASGHAGAQAIAAIMRDQAAVKEPLVCRFSVEGSTLRRTGNVIEECAVRRVSVTVKPCNRTAISGILADPCAPEGFSKDPENVKDKQIAHELQQAVKSEHQHPVYTKLGGSVELPYDPVMSEHSLEKSLKQYVRARVLLKAITAGQTSAAPSALTGSAALQREDASLRRHQVLNQAKAALRDYGHRIGQHNRADFLKFVKHRLPDADPSFIERFADLVDQYSVKLHKTEVTPFRMDALSIELRKAAEQLAFPQPEFHQEVLQPLKVHADLHGLHVHHPEQRAMLHGLDVRNRVDTPQHVESGVNDSGSAWVQTPDRSLAYLKPDSRTVDEARMGGFAPRDWSSAQREVAYHNIAHSVFGLGHHVPRTVGFRHPLTGVEHSLQEAVPDAQHGTVEHYDILEQLGDSGELDKLAAMNHILGNSDRHGGNYVFSRSKAPGLFLIDHGLAFRGGGEMPYYAHHYAAQHPATHPEALKWLTQLSPETLRREMDRHGAPERTADLAVARLERSQRNAGLFLKNPDLYDTSFYALHNQVQHGGNTAGDASDIARELESSSGVDKTPDSYDERLAAMGAS